MERINIVVVGLHFGRCMLESNMIDGPGAAYIKVTGVCDLNAPLAAELAQKYGVRAYASLNEVLADPTVPAVALFTGPIGRAKLVEKIIRAGKDVMTTKPFELDPEAALAVLRLAKSLGRVVHLNSPNPLLPADLTQMSQWHTEFKLGRPIAANFQVWCSYREPADNSWYDDWDRCPVAPIFRLGIYALNDIVYFLGEPESVQVTHSRIFTGRPTPDNGILTIRFQNGALASVFASFCISGDFPYANTTTFNFEHGSIFRNVGPHVDSKAGRLELVTGGPAAVITRVAKPEGEWSGGYQWANFQRALSGEKLAGEISPEQIVAAVRIIAAMAKAQHSGRTEMV